MQHIFRAYVLRLKPRAENDSARVATVIEQHASPGFTVISYRRAPTLRGRLSDPAAPVNPHPERVDAETDDMRELRGGSRVNFASDIAHDVASSPETGGNAGVDSSHSSGAGASRGAENALARQSYAPEFTIPQRAPTYWSAPLDAHTKEKLQHARILTLFLRVVPLRDFGFYSDAMTNDIRLRWLYPVVAHVHQPLGGHYMSTLSLATLLGSFGSRDTTLGLSVRCQPVVTTCVSALLRLYDSRYVPQSLQSVAAMLHDDAADTSGARRGIPDKSQLIELFSSFVDQVYDSVSHFLSQEYGVDSVGTLVDDVISLTFQEDALATVRQPVMDTLRDSPGARSFYLAMFRKFVAQINEISFGLRTPRVNRSSSSAAHPWSGSWLLDTQSARMTASRARQYTSPTILQFVHCLHQALCIDLRVRGSECSIRSAVASTGSFSESGMRLVLDGRSRVFGAFPNGMASMGTLEMGSEWTWGDYTGRIAGDGQWLQVVFFTFREQTDRASQEVTNTGLASTSAVYRMTVNVTSRSEKLDAGHDDEVWVLSVPTVVESAVFPSEEGGRDDLAGMPCSSRVARFTQLEWTHVATVGAVYNRVKA